jgi:hypothetical protein
MKLHPRLQPVVRIWRGGCAQPLGYTVAFNFSTKAINLHVAHSPWALPMMAQTWNQQRTFVVPSR